jgi:pyrroline-5-carboxylate reductase
MDTPQLAQKPTTITFIGAGNMARSLIVGLLQDQANVVLRVADPDQQQLDAIRKHWPDVLATTDNLEAIQGADVVVLAVKPQIMREVTETLAEAAQRSRPLFVSIAAGIREEALNRWLGGNQAIVRCMPNTPALVQAGATGLTTKPNWMLSPRFLAVALRTSSSSWKPCKRLPNNSASKPPTHTC